MLTRHMLSRLSASFVQIGARRPVLLLVSPGQETIDAKEAFDLPFRGTYSPFPAFLYLFQDPPVMKTQRRSRQDEQASDSRERDASSECTISRQANTACHSCCSLGYIVLRWIQTMGIVRMVLLFVSGKQVFVLVTGCRRSEGRTQRGKIGRWESRGSMAEL